MKNPIKGFSIEGSFVPQDDKEFLRVLVILNAMKNPLNEVRIFK